MGMGNAADRNRPVYAAVLYHDSEENASEDSKDIGHYPSLQAAVRAVNEQRSDHWQTGQVIYGFLWPAIFGKRPERFESDLRETSWFVGTDGKAER